MPLLEGRAWRVAWAPCGRLSWLAPVGLLPAELRDRFDVPSTATRYGERVGARLLISAVGVVNSYAARTLADGPEEALLVAGGESSAYLRGAMANGLPV